MGLFDRGKDPKEVWLVPGAKHNRCLERDPARTQQRFATFSNGLLRAARHPRSPRWGCRRPSRSPTPTPTRSGLPIWPAKSSPPFRADRAVSHRAQAMMKFLSRVVGAPGKWPGSAAGPGVPRTDPTGRRRPARAAAAQAVAARRQPVRPRPSLRRDPHPGRLSPPRADRRLRPPRAVHRPRAQGRDVCPLRPGDRGPDVRHDLGHDQPAQDDPGDRASPCTTIARAGPSGASWRSTRIPRSSATDCGRSSRSPATGARNSRPRASPVARSPA